MSFMKGSSLPSLLTAFTDSDPVLIDAVSGREVKRGEIIACSEMLLRKIPRAGLVFLMAEQSVDSVVFFHALLEAGIPTALLDATLEPEMLNELVGRYLPEAVLGPCSNQQLENYHCSENQILIRDNNRDVVQAHSDLAILLTTSGSTGSPKFVRLSKENIWENASSIASSLSLVKSDMGITALPTFYSFGMSVLTSHASVGSPVLVSASSVLDIPFWEQMEKWGVSLLPGVPQTYLMIRRLGLIEKRLDSLPKLRALLQAGGRLENQVIEDFNSLMIEHNGSFYVMYGQTEASPRITCLPPEMLNKKLGSVGVPLKGGEVEIRGQNGERLPANQSGDVFYSGPNVMMGYATSRSDLSLGDTHGNLLKTGDVGFLDDDGFLFLTGRVSRIAKIYGTRVSMDEVESMTSHLGRVAVVEGKGDCMFLFFVDEMEESDSEQRKLANKLRVPVKAVNFRWIADIPRLNSGKVNYELLSRIARGEDHDD
jgi:acyl-CoA synthetase (AMP-forming)/AMP-acid ligase II